jgi:N-dimethylarginine dimethylaminohydrolase
VDLMGGPTRAAAYHGAGWRPRVSTLAAELREGVLWRAAGADSEWARLRAVLLALPPTGWPAPADWNDALYLAPVRFSRLRRQLDDYAAVMAGLDIQVLADELPATGSAGPPYNGLFVRDQFFMTPEGAVVSRLGSIPRAPEARLVTAALAARGVPILCTIRGDGCFEGADALWLRPDLVAIGVGNRTNDAGAAQVATILAAQGVRARQFRLPRGIQHLLGLLQIVAADLAVVRTAHAPVGLLDALAAAGIGVLGAPETPAVAHGQAMNVVTVASRRVVMAQAPEFRRHLERNGVEVVASLDCSELIKCAGGLACATGILHREPAAAPAPGAPGGSTTSNGKESGPTHGRAEQGPVY